MTSIPGSLRLAELIASGELDEEGLLAWKEGRVVAGLLAFVGIGLFGFASAQLTARLLGQSDRTAQELRELRAEIASLRGLLVKSNQSDEGGSS